MKILLVDSRVDGHHISYLSCLVDGLIANGDSVIAVLPDQEYYDSTINCKVYKSKNCYDHQLSYYKWINEIRSISLKEKPDIIHFLFGDAFYRFFSIGFRGIKGKRIITCHQIRFSRLRDISYKVMSINSSALVVHTKKLENDFINLGIHNVYHIEYPQFSKQQIVYRNEAKRKLKVDVDDSNKILLALGGTRYDKGLDLLLEALNNVNKPFHLIIAGKEEAFDKEYILNKIEKYKNSVTLFLGFLSEEMFMLCIDASDIIVLPYRKSFDGASGPLGEGVWHFKQIIGPNHKSLGDLITDNHLGTTFECEDIKSLANAIKKSLESDWVPDDQYIDYRDSLDPVFFQAKYLELYDKCLKGQLC